MRYGVVAPTVRVFIVVVIATLIATVLGPTHTPTEAALATWSSGGPYGGWVGALAISSADSDTMLAGTSQGLFRTTSAGARWHPVSSELRYRYVSGVAFDVDDASVAYATGNNRVFRSTDGGETWASTTVEDPRGVETAPGVVDVVQLSRVVRSRDRGKTWAVLDSVGERSIEAWATARSDVDTVYMATRRHDTGDRVVWRSRNAGETWQRTPLEGAYDLVVDPRDANVVYAANPDGGVDKTVDGGVTWSRAWEPDGWSAYKIALAPSDPSVVLVHGEAHQGAFVLRSTDGGATWATTQRIASHSSGGALAVDPQTPLTVYLGTGGDGVHRSLDGGATFHSRTSGIAAASATAISTDPTDARVIYATLESGGLFGSFDAGATWFPSTAGLDHPDYPYAGYSVSSVAVAAGGTVFAGRNYPSVWAYGGGTVLASTNGGQTWSPRSEGLPTDMDVAHLVAHPTRGGTLLAAFERWNDQGEMVGRIFRTDNGGTSWTNVSPVNAPTSSLTVDPRTGRVFAATGIYDSDETDDRLYSSRDFGWTWDRLPYPRDLTQVGSIGVDEHSGRLYAGSAAGGQVAISDDAGESWTYRRLHNDGSDIMDVAVDPLDPSQVFAGTRGDGVWYSQDGGMTWQALTPDLRGQFVYVVAFGEPASTVTASYGAAAVSTATALRHRPAFLGGNARRRHGVARMIPAPHNRRRPRVDGVLKVGRRVRCEPRRWSRATNFSYRWLRNGEKISRATSRGYELRQRDRGERVACVVYASGPGGRARARSRALRIR